eukprot:4302098-Pleurochrysis_carterae.AAC.1
MLRASSGAVSSATADALAPPGLCLCFLHSNSRQPHTCSLDCRLQPLSLSASFQSPGQSFRSVAPPRRGNLHTLLS